MKYRSIHFNPKINFKGITNFSQITAGNAGFTINEFQDKAFFNDFNINADGSFIDTKFMQDAVFTNAKLSRNSYHGREEIEKFEFKNLKIHSKAKLIFKNSDLSNTEFISVDISKISLENPLYSRKTFEKVDIVLKGVWLRNFVKWIRGFIKF